MKLITIEETQVNQFIFYNMLDLNTLVFQLSLEIHQD
jgi:hypothetical protein